VAAYLSRDNREYEIENLFDDGLDTLARTHIAAGDFDDEVRKRAPHLAAPPRHGLEEAAELALDVLDAWGKRTEMGGSAHARHAADQLRRALADLNQSREGGGG
jgi:hypothetical protein